jgi:hypothetical protein
MFKTLFVVTWLAAGAVWAVESDDLGEPLQSFKPFLNKTWKSLPSASGQEKTMVDVSRWERAMNGQAIRVLHSVNDGEYGGETIIMWDKEKQELVFFYFTTAGFYTHGTMTVTGTRIVSHEQVIGNKNGITQVKSTSEIMPDGAMKTQAYYGVNGKWEEGHSFMYIEDSAAQIKFK